MDRHLEQLQSGPGHDPAEGGHYPNSAPAPAVVQSLRTSLLRDVADLSGCVQPRDDAIVVKKTMSDFDKSGEETESVVQKLDAVSASVDRRFTTLSASLDERFDAVDEALVEQRQYTEFAFDRLRDGLGDEMRKGFDSVESRFNRLERKLDQFIDTQFRANQLVERRLTALEAPSGQE